VARLLLERGTNATTQNQNGWTALHMVAADGYKEVVRLLLGEDASVVAQAWDGTTVLGSESAIY
jgi:ankyrin repeat protein